MTGDHLHQTILGRTGFRVSRMGLGGGGHSRLGARTGRSRADSVAVVRRAIELGINFIDTAESYGTEDVVAEGIRESRVARERIVISTKKGFSKDHPLTPAELREALEASLRRLKTDYVDVYHLHGLHLAQYEHAVNALVPEMLNLKEAGKTRAIGVTEAFNSDRRHDMLRRAMRDDCWDVIMVGFNILNQSARDTVLASAIAKNIGVLGMFVVRAALTQPTKLRETIGELIRRGELERSLVDDVDDRLGFLVRDGVASSVTDAGYRFCRDEPGMHVVLSGTGNIAHLEENCASMQRPPLPAAVRAKLVGMFQGIDSVSGQ